MHDPLVVRGLERLRDLFADRDGIVNRDGAARNEFGQRFAFDQLEDQIPRASHFLELVDDRNVGMIQRGQRLRLPLESGQPLRVVREQGRQRLHRDLTPQFRVPGPIHFAHPARSQQVQNLVRLELGPSR